MLEWESLDRQVKTLEANKGVKGSRSGASSQVEEWLAVIEDNQRQLGDAIKDLYHKGEVCYSDSSIRDEWAGYHGKGNDDGFR